ncbi:UPF0721 transmembrane protein [Geomonas sp. Red276]
MFIQYVIITSVAFFAACLSSMSGAGAGMLTTPVWLALGFPLPVVVASNQLNGAIWTPLAARNYLKGRTVDWRLVLFMIAVGLAGAYAGTTIIRGASQHLLQRIIGGIILSLVVLVAINPSLGENESDSRLSRAVTGLLAFPLGVYESFFGSGNGLFTSMLLVKSRGLTLPTALGYYYLIAFFWNGFAVAVYSAGGYADAGLMLPSTIGSLAGAYLGSRIGRRSGHLVVRRVFLVLGGVLGTRLALGW